MSKTTIPFAQRRAELARRLAEATILDADSTAGDVEAAERELLAGGGLAPDPTRPGVVEMRTVLALYKKLPRPEDQPIHVVAPVHFGAPVRARGARAAPNTGAS